jgi:hypothetical protein
MSNLYLDVILVNFIIIIYIYINIRRAKKH